MTYKISKPKERRKVRGIPPASRQPRAIWTNDELEAILKNNLKKTYFKVGDCVKFKKPRKPVVYGRIVAIQETIMETTWGNGGSMPMNIVIELVKRDPNSGIVYGTERVKTNVKKIVFYNGVME